MDSQIETARHERVAAPQGAEAAAGGLSVAAIIDTAIISGPGRQLVAQAVRQSDGGNRFCIVTFRRKGRPDSPFVAYARAMGVRCHVIEEKGRLDVSVFRSLRAVLNDANVKLVQTHGYRPTTVVWALRALGWYRGAWIGFYHGETAENRKVKVYHAIDRRLLRAADRIVVMAQSQLRRFAPVASRTALLHNAVLDAPRRQSADVPRDELSPSPVPRIAVVGRLSHEKGVDVLLDALARLRGVGCDVELVIAGDGPERGALEAQAVRQECGGHVRFLGQLSSVEAVYESSDLVVLPSRSEGLPNVLLEALRHGRFVVATRVGAVPEVLEGTRAGVLVAPGDSAALAEGILLALATRDAPGVAEDRARILERFSLDARVRALRRLHAETVQGCAPVDG